MRHLEYCSPVYSSALTKQQQQDLARVHRCVVAAITGTYARGEEFEEICSRLGLEADLGQRRLRLAERFAKRVRLLQLNFREIDEEVLAIIRNLPLMSKKLPQNCSSALRKLP